MASHRFQRRRALLLGTGLQLLIVMAIAGISLMARPTAAGILLDPAIPHERALIAAGLSGTPGPNQPTAPVAVDRVLVDGTATYIQYHIIQPLGTVDGLSPALTDDHGASLNVGSSGTDYPPGLTLPFPLPAWLPCHPMVSRRAVTIIDAPLPTTAHAAVLRFDGPGAHETVRVPLDLHALARRRLTHPGTTAHAAGFTLTLQDLDFTHLTYAYTSPPSGMPSFVPERILLADGAGHAVTVATIGGACGGNAGGAGSLNCAQWAVFSPQRAGTYLTLTIPAFRVYGARWLTPPARPLAAPVHRPLAALPARPFLSPLHSTLRPF